MPKGNQPFWGAPHLENMPSFRGPLVQEMSMRLISAFATCKCGFGSRCLLVVLLLYLYTGLVP